MEELLNTAPCGYLSVSDDGRITAANRTLEEMLGYEAGTLPGTPVDRIFPVASRIFYQTHLFPLLKLHNRADEVYLSVRTRSGSDLPVLVNAVRRERAGAIINECILVQMKERSEYEDAILRAKKEAEAATRSRDEFLAMVSHELRRPLASIMGWTQILLSDDMEDKDERTKALEAVARGTSSLERLIADLMDHSRMISGQLQINVEPVTLDTVVNAALEVVKPAAEARSILIEPSIDEGAGPVSGDPERLQQVVWNLLSNAVKFTPKKGRIEIRLARVNSSVEISVSDTGKGIAADFLPYVFDRFQQAQTTGSRHGGLGLGMAISKQLVELHGGTIKAESPGEGKGSTFTVRLPVMTIREPQRPNGDDPASRNGRPVDAVRLDGVRVLVVEDDAEARRLLKTVLERTGAGVKAVATAGEGLETLRAGGMHVLLSDVELPDDDGYSLMRSVRSLDGADSASVPAIALTAHAGRADRVKALTAGFQMHLVKPVEPVELVLAIANLLNRGNDQSS